MNAAPLQNRAHLGNARNSQPESLEARISRLETLVASRQSRGMERPAPKPVVAKSYPRMDIDEMKREVDRRVAAMRTAEKKILDRVSGRAA